LQHDVQDARVRFLGFVEQENARRRLLSHVAEHSDFTRFRAEQQTE
jgi:hypothetical protein